MIYYILYYILYSWHIISYILHYIFIHFIYPHYFFKISLSMQYAYQSECGSFSDTMTEACESDDTTYDDENRDGAVDYMKYFKTTTDSSSSCDSNNIGDKERDENTGDIAADRNIKLKGEFTIVLGPVNILEDEEVLKFKQNERTILELLMKFRSDGLRRSEAVGMVHEIMSESEYKCKLKKHMIRKSEIYKTALSIENW